MTAKISSIIDHSTLKEVERALFVWLEKDTGKLLLVVGVGTDKAMPVIGSYKTISGVQASCIQGRPFP